MPENKENNKVNIIKADNNNKEDKIKIEIGDENKLGQDQTRANKKKTKGEDKLDSSGVNITQIGVNLNINHINNVNNPNNTNNENNN